MPPAKRPPTTDADYEVVHGPWPRWMLHLSLIKLALSAGAVVLACLLAGLAILAAMGAFR